LGTFKLVRVELVVHKVFDKVEELRVETGLAVVRGGLRLQAQVDGNVVGDLWVLCVVRDLLHLLQTRVGDLKGE